MLCDRRDHRWLWFSAESRGQNRRGLPLEGLLRRRGDRFVFVRRERDQDSEGVVGLEPGEHLTARECCRRLQSLTGDLYDIYREIPRPMTDERHGKLAAGVARFLESTK